MTEAPGLPIRSPILSPDRAAQWPDADHTGLRKRGVKTRWAKLETGENFHGKNEAIRVAQLRAGTVASRERAEGAQGCVSRRKLTLHRLQSEFAAFVPSPGSWQEARSRS